MMTLRIYDEMFLSNGLMYKKEYLIKQYSLKILLILFLFSFYFLPLLDFAFGLEEDFLLEEAFAFLPFDFLSLSSFQLL